MLKGAAAESVRELTPVAPLPSDANALVLDEAVPVSMVQQPIRPCAGAPGQGRRRLGGVGSSNDLSVEPFARQRASSPSTRADEALAQTWAGQGADTSCDDPARLAAR